MMLAVKEVLLILVVTVIQKSFEQSTSILSTKYEGVAVKANSFNVIRTTTSSNALLCASMCATNANCETYYYDASQCHEASASSLERATSNLLTAKYAYIDQNVYRSKKVDGVWDWGSWSTCSTTCGTGTRTRSANSCIGPFYAGKPCSGSGIEYDSCQVEGAWTVWDAWGSCSKTCGTGTQLRARNFTNGMPCTGSLNETQACKVEGAWALWGNWSSCSTTCDSSGTWSRSRNHIGNMPCSGSNLETEGCQAEGMWETWTAWGACSGTCDSNASKNRSRSFMNGTRPCTDTDKDVSTCSVEGVWSTWGAWDSCSGGQTTKSRMRNYTGGILPCSGNDKETESVLAISYEDCYSSCSGPSYVGKNVFTDNVPEASYNQIWIGNMGTAPQKLRITFSCNLMTVNSVTMRNSVVLCSYCNTKDFEIKVREPNSSQWKPFVAGTLTDPSGQNPPPLETFTGSQVVIEEMEFTCLSYYTTYCGLNYIGFA